MSTDHDGAVIFPVFNALGAEAVAFLCALWIAETPLASLTDKIAERNSL